MRRSGSFVALLAVASILSACGQTPLVRATTKAINFGADVPDAMRGRNVAGIVAYDEDFVGRYGKVSKNVLYMNGVEQGSAEYGYRIVRVNIGFSEGNFMFKAGKTVFYTGGYVPDGLPPLKAGDVVELRQTGTWDTMKEFASTGEGNVVLRVLCPAAGSDYQACFEKSPHIGDFGGRGETGTPYPASLKHYGFTFTPRYHLDGTRITP